MKDIAIYGKGGIGKSTVCANLSAALADTGRRVLQIGCDPKHDSTRALLHGRRITTVLDYMRDTTPLEYKLGDVLHTGYGGVGCVEAGGPKPGVGCAGRGIISTFEFLENFGVRGHYDLTLYDVLGDVVCGGFAVPIRREYADSIFIVSSGEFMSLYAANNILRGVLNYDAVPGGDDSVVRRRVAGIIFNRRNVQDEDGRVERFARAVGLPIVTVVPRDDAFAEAERQGMTVIESANSPEIAAIFSELAERIVEGMPLYAAAPLSDEDLEEIVLGTGVISSAPSASEEAKLSEPSSVDLETEPERYLSLSVARNEPLHGCAFNGAITMAVHIRDAVILAHAPRSCGYITYQGISSTGRRALFERGAILPASLSPNFTSTEMGESEMVFGGMDTLRDKLAEIRETKPKAIIIVSACPSGIIGDDITELEVYSTPEMPVVAIRADGNLSGDYLQGMIMCYLTLARGIIRHDTEIVPDTVNVVFEKVIAKNTETNFEMIEYFLRELGISVNCRFLSNTSFESLANFKSAPLNLLAYGDYTGRMLEEFFTGEFESVFLDQPFPVGFDDSVSWLRKVAAFFNHPEQIERAESIIEQYTREYEREVVRLRSILEGRRLLIITYNHNVDWILRTAFDLGIEVPKICIMNYSQDRGFNTKLDVTLNVEEGFDASRREEEIERYKPDILLTNYAFNSGGVDYIADTIPLCPDVGFFSGLNLARRWAALIRLNIQGDWKNDEQLFRKHYAK